MSLRYVIKNPTREQKKPGGMKSTHEAMKQVAQAKMKHKEIVLVDKEGNNVR